MASVTTAPDLKNKAVLTSGVEVVLGRDDHALQGSPPAAGNLLLFGTQPEHWYLSLSFSTDLDCYWISVSRAYSEPDSVVLAFEGWSGVGVRLPKAPGFDDSRLATKDAEGRLRYSGIGSISFCSDAEGGLSGV